MSHRTDSIRLLLTGGGTGGHLFPAVATAQAFQAKMAGTEVLFVGTRRKVDTKSLETYGFASRTITSYGLKGKNLPSLLKALAVMPLSYWQALQIIKEFHPDILFGVGGYVTGPVILAAKRQRIPVVIHEQNSIPGMANKKLAGLADKICLSIPGSGEIFPADKVVYTGNPVRQSILRLAAEERAGDKDRRTLFILGGSQGAVGVNSLVMEALTLLSHEERRRLHVIHQTGDLDYERINAFYDGFDISVEVQPFFSAMDEVYRRVDLLVCRAGATTLAEISVLGLPAILIPFPYAADNHQEKNAEYYVQGGGAECYRQRELSGKSLAGHLRRLIFDSELLARMSRAMKKMGQPAAADNIVACCLDVMKR